MRNKYKLPPRRPKKKIRSVVPIPAIPYAENAKINAGIAADPDTYVLTDREFKQLRPYVFGRRYLKYAPKKPRH
jgi:hypothetical protein